MNKNSGFIETYDSYLARLYPDLEQFEKNLFNITFQVTDACNLKCSYCYQINKGNHKMTFDNAKKFIDLLLDNNEYTKLYVDTYSIRAAVLDFIGGEPLLEVELIEKIIDYFVEQSILKNHPWQYNYRISISTNGTLYFNPEVQNFIAKYKDHLSFGITIDGHKELHDLCRVFPDGSGSYDIAMAAVHHYHDVYEGALSSKITLSPENISLASKAVIHLIEEGYTDINGNCVYEKGWNYSHATIFYNELKILANYLLANNLTDTHRISFFKEDSFCPMALEDNNNWCGGNGRMIALDYKGDIYPCLRYMESSLGDNVSPIIIGNVNDGIMTKKECVDCVLCLKQVNRISQSTKECIYCPIAKGCSWCQAYNYQDSGNFNHRATYICCMHQANALANYYYWNQYYIQNNQNKQLNFYLEDNKALNIISYDELKMLKSLNKNLI